MRTIENITSPGVDPVEGDWVRITNSVNSSVVEKQFHVDTEPSAEEIASAARSWRNAELQTTDWIAQTPDHPQRDSYLAYRTSLRDWPATSDFPATRPELGG
tara:strand:- start:809 stop:1114 length:306 start_codon:yes stop_codon:yes gene_type:complete